MLEDRLSSRAIKRKLVKVLHSKIEKLKQKQLKKRQIKLQSKQESKEHKESGVSQMPKEVVIRLRPLT
jgi:hypothetical protein